MESSKYIHTAAQLSLTSEVAMAGVSELVVSFSLGVWRWCVWIRRGGEGWLVGGDWMDCRGGILSNSGMSVWPRRGAEVL